VIPLRIEHGGVSFTVKVHPRARRTGVTGALGDALKLSLTAPPAEGRANQACVEYFAGLFHVPRASVTIAAGETSRTKVVRVAGITREAAQKSLEGALTGR
jgi:uncharacterized protein (TIGR00251 family)